MTYGGLSTGVRKVVKFLKVKRIRRFGKERVYDITTLTHTFLANGIVVHNSMATPHVSGLLACAAQMYRDVLGRELTVGEVKRMMEQLGHPKTNDDGWGLIAWQLFEEWVSTQYGVKI
jgi:hypothetical protein